MKQATADSNPHTAPSSVAGVSTAARLAHASGRLALLAVLVIAVALFSLLEPSTFGTLDNLRSIALNQSTVLFLALAAMLPLIVGRFDLSIAAVLTLTQVLVVGLPLQNGTPVSLAVLIGLAAAGFVGLANGIVVGLLGVNSFIATLAMSSVVSGIVLWYTAGDSIYGEAPAALNAISHNELAGVPLPIIYCVVTVACLATFLQWASIGKRTYATGSNPRAAALVGIPTGAYVVAAFVTGSLMAGGAGVILGSSVGAATPDSGASLLIPAFAGAFLGATAFSPGRFNPLGTLVAIYLVGVLVNGLQQVGAAPWATPVFNGAILLIAVGLATWISRLRTAGVGAPQLAGTPPSSTAPPVETGAAIPRSRRPFAVPPVTSPGQRGQEQPPTARDARRPPSGGSRRGGRPGPG